MAEFAVAASVLQVADVGFGLAKSIHNFVVTAKNAPKDLEVVAQDIRLLSIVLRRAHAQIQSAGSLNQDAICTDLREVVLGTETAFQDVQKLVDELGGEHTNLVAKIQYALGKKERIEVLRANLEKRKTTVLVMIAVIGLGSTVSAKKSAADDDVVDVAKLEVRTLIEAKKTAARKYETLIAPHLPQERAGYVESMRASSPASAGMQALMTLSSPSPNSLGPINQQPPPSPVIARSSETSETQETASSSQDPQSRGVDVMPLATENLTASLQQCRAAIDILQTRIMEAHYSWRNSERIDDVDIVASLQETSKTITGLRRRIIEHREGLFRDEYAASVEGFIVQESRMQRLWHSLLPSKSSSKRPYVAEVDMSVASQTTVVHRFQRSSGPHVMMHLAGLSGDPEDILESLSLRPQEDLLTTENQSRMHAGQHIPSDEGTVRTLEDWQRYGHGTNTKLASVSEADEETSSSVYEDPFDEVDRLLKRWINAAV